MDAKVQTTEDRRQQIQSKLGLPIAEFPMLWQWAKKLQKELLDAVNSLWIHHRFLHDELVNASW